MCFNRRVRKQISVLVPFQSHEAFRIRVWNWLKLYWRYHLPGVEIIIGQDPKSRKAWYRPNPKPFSKTTAVNNAFKKSHGDIIVILDADTYMKSNVIEHCAHRLREARKAGVHLWFVPYQWIFRLTKGATIRVLESNPHRPLHFSTPPPADDVEGTDGSGWGRRFGALIMIMPREAFIEVGGMDERFRGWGGEDVGFLLAMDTLWGKHKNTPNQVLHLWHPKLRTGLWTDMKGKEWETRAWAHQLGPGANDWLASLYHKAANNPQEMISILKEDKMNKLRRNKWTNQ